MARASRLLIPLAALVCAVGSCALPVLGQQAPFEGTPPADPVREAEETLLASVERATAGENAVALGDALRNLGAFYHTRERYSDARRLFERALAVREQALGRNHADVLQSLGDLALLDSLEGDTAAAVSRYERILRIQRRLYGRNAQQTAVTMNSLARLHASAGDLRRAIGYHANELAILESVYGGNSIRLVSTLAALADLERRRGDAAAAESLLRRGIAIAEADEAPASQRRLAELLEAYAAVLAPLPARAAESAALAQRASEIRALNRGVDRRASAE